MADAFIGEIRAFGFTWTPDGWLPCNGATFPISQFTALYSVIGNAFGGTVNQTFAVPNLQGASTPQGSPGHGYTPIGSGQGPNLSSRVFSQTVGEVSVAVNQSQMASHLHSMTLAAGASGATEIGTPDATSYVARPVNTTVTPPVALQAFVQASATPANTTMALATLGAYGGGLPHENRQPLLAMNFCINWNGFFPSRT